ncbi:hypothetical protein LSUE1_G010143, partial [Lachnellula suecica]
MAPQGEPRDSVGEAITAEGPDDTPFPKPHAGENLHSRTSSTNLNEYHGLLHGPRIQFRYDTANRFKFPSTATTIQPPRKEKKKGIHVPSWASVPDYLEEKGPERMRTLLVDAFLVLVSIPFFALAGVIIQLDGEKVVGHQLYALDQCIKCAATFFPLFFSFIVGRAAIKIASWKLERGTTLGLLESLMGSRTVGGTFVTQLRLWPLTFMGVGLIALWSLSPLSSQAILRMVSTTDSAVPAPLNISYTSTRQPSYSGDSQFQNSWFAGFASMFGAALLAPPAVKTSPMDLWGNVKIPLFSSLSDLPQDQNGWRNIPQNNASINYSSLFGIPISALPAGNSTFQLESTYLELSCPNRTSSLTRSYDPNSTQGSTFYNPDLISTSGPFLGGLNVTSDTSWAVGYLGSEVESFLPSNDPASQCLDCLPSNLTTQTALPGLFLYQDFEGAHNVTSIYCTPSQAYVESNIFCTQTSTTQSCAVVSQRLSLLPHISSALTPLSFSTVLDGLSEFLPLATQKLSGVDTMQNYIVSPLDNNFIQSTKAPGLAITPATSNISTPETESRFLELPLSDFSTRLSQIINTYLQGSTLDSTTYLTGSALPSSPNPVAATPSEVSAQIQNPFITVPANSTQLVLIYTASYPWLAISLLSTTLLLAAALTAAIISRLTLTRDYLPYVSSLLCESQFSSMHQGGVQLDGLSRSRECRDLRVRLGD